MNLLVIQSHTHYLSNVEETSTGCFDSLFANIYCRELTRRVERQYLKVEYEAKIAAATTSSDEDEEGKIHKLLQTLSRRDGIVKLT